jgi:hypothetical protein
MWWHFIQSSLYTIGDFMFIEDDRGEELAHYFEYGRYLHRPTYLVPPIPSFEPLAISITSNIVFIVANRVALMASPMLLP